MHVASVSPPSFATPPDIQPVNRSAVPQIKSPAGRSDLDPAIKAALDAQTQSPLLMLPEELQFLILDWRAPAATPSRAGPGWGNVRLSSRAGKLVFARHFASRHKEDLDQHISRKVRTALLSRIRTDPQPYKEAIVLSLEAARPVQSAREKLSALSAQVEAGFHSFLKILDLPALPDAAGARPAALKSAARAEAEMLAAKKLESSKIATTVQEVFKGPAVGLEFSRDSDPLPALLAQAGKLWDKPLKILANGLGVDRASEVLTTLGSLQLHCPIVLELRSNGLVDADLRRFLPLLKSLDCLVSLDLSQNPLCAREECCVSLVELMPSFPALQRLYLQNIGCNDETAVQLAHPLRRHPALLHLDLQNNLIQEHGTLCLIRSVGRFASGKAEANLVIEALWLLNNGPREGFASHESAILSARKARRDLSGRKDDRGLIQVNWLPFHRESNTMEAYEIYQEQLEKSAALAEQQRL